MTARVGAKKGEFALLQLDEDLLGDAERLQDVLQRGDRVGCDELSEEVLVLVLVRHVGRPLWVARRVEDRADLSREVRPGRSEWPRIE